MEPSARLEGNTIYHQPRVPTSTGVGKITELTINTRSSYYPAYQKLEEKYKTEMYDLSSDPKADRMLMPIVWRKMDYAVGSFGLDLVDLIVQSGMEIIDETKSEPKIYQRVLEHVRWINEPTDLVDIGTGYYQKRELKWGLGEFLVTHFVKAIPLPPKT